MRRFSHPAPLLASATLGLALLGCIEDSPYAHMGQPRRPRDGQAASAPVAAAPAQAEGFRANGAIFANALQVVGYRVDPARPTPGSTITVTTQLRVLAPIPQDAMMFVHIDDSEGRPNRVNGDHWPANHKAPMNSWKVGEVVQDQFQVTLGGFDESQAVTVWLGFFEPASGDRLPLANADKVRNDGNHRIALADVPLR